MTYATDMYILYRIPGHRATQSAAMAVADRLHVVKSGQPQTNFFQYLPTPATTYRSSWVILYILYF